MTTEYVTDSRLMDDKWLRSKEDKLFIVRVSPEVAKDWLGRMPGTQRKVRRPSIEKYSSSMRSDVGFVTGNDAFVFDANGKMINGQHRCETIVATGVAYERAILRLGADPAEYACMDQGAVRRARDVFKYRGIDANDTEAALTRLIFAMRKGVVVVNVGNEEVADYVAANPQVRESAVIGRYFSKRGLGSPARIAFAHWLVSVQNQDAKDAVDAFFSSILLGTELSEGDPALTARNRLFRDGKHLPRLALESLIVRAWNYHVEGKKTRAIGNLNDIPAALTIDGEKSDSGKGTGTQSATILCRAIIRAAGGSIARSELVAQLAKRAGVPKPVATNLVKTAEGIGAIVDRSGKLSIMGEEK